MCLCPHRWCPGQASNHAGWPTSGQSDGGPAEETAEPHVPGLEGRPVRLAAAHALCGLGNGLVHGEAFGH